MKLHELLTPVINIAREAGAAILKVYATDFKVQAKQDESPLTQADLAAHECISAGLRKLTPNVPIISEESGLPDFAERSQWPRYWLVDPLDGTKEFVKRNGEFTVNIALIDNHRPVLGVVFVPVQNVTYTGCAGQGSHKISANGASSAVHVSSHCASPARIVGSRSHRAAAVDDFLAKLGSHTMLPMGSSLKFCIIAEGGADAYPRLGPTSEWDTAAAQAVVEQAGGAVVTLDGEPMLYNQKSDILNPHFLVTGPTDIDWLSFLPKEIR